MSEWLVGGYGADMSGTAEGVGVLRSRGDGTLEFVAVADAVESPSYLIAHSDHVYGVLEGEGQVQSWRLTGTQLEPDGRASSGGTAPCNLAIFDGRLVAANYGDGVLGVIGLDANGAIAELLQAIPGPTDNLGPHADQTVSRQHAALDLGGGVLASLDLGTDELHVHRIVHGAVSRYDSFALPKGTGPRDIARHPSGLIVVLGELDATMHLLEWADGFTLLSSVQLPQVPREHAAALAFSEDGRFAYTSLRRSNRVAIVAVDEDERRLSFIDVVPCGGQWGRHLVIEGDLLHVANQLSNDVTTLRIGADGIPQHLAGGTAVSTPSFLLRIS